jgi:hypothetical protein
MHVSDGRRYMLLDRPTRRVTVNRDGTTVGFEQWRDVELVSHEVRSFGERLLDRDLASLEAALAGDVVLDTLPEYTDALRDIVASALPLDVPAKYQGMARSARESLGPDAAPKPYLHALRGALAAEHLHEQGEFRADLRALSRAVLGDDDLAVDLIAARDGEFGDDLRARATALVDGRLAAVDPADAVEPDRLRRRLDGWILDLRREVTAPL